MQSLVVSSTSSSLKRRLQHLYKLIVVNMSLDMGFLLHSIIHVNVSLRNRLFISLHLLVITIISNNIILTFIINSYSIFYNVLKRAINLARELRL